VTVSEFMAQKRQQRHAAPPVQLVAGKAQFVKAIYHATRLWWLGQHVRHDGKEMFDSEGQAVAVLEWYQHRNRGYWARGLVAYECHVCGKWFLGHYAGDHVVCLEV
jgi:hypothetical protein